MYVGTGPKAAPNENTMRAHGKLPLFRIDVINILSFSFSLSSLVFRFCKLALKNTCSHMFTLIGPGLKMEISRTALNPAFLVLQSVRQGP